MYCNRNFRLILSGILLLSFSQFIHSQNPEDTEVWSPVPPIVNPDLHGGAPSDAIILFDGTSLSEWVDNTDSIPSWGVCEGVLTIGKGSIYTRQSFGDCQLHIEWRAPSEVNGDGQGRGNSGIYIQSRYEVQILDSYENPTYSNGQAASIYKQYSPLVNASLAPGNWQVYDIIFTSPRFDENGTLLKTGTITVLHNGILVHNAVELKGTTEYIGEPKNIAHGDEPIMIQDHGNPVSFRNIWIRKI